MSSNMQIRKPTTHQIALAEYCNWNRAPVLLPGAGEQAILLADVDHMIQRLCQDPSHDLELCNQPTIHTSKLKQQNAIQTHTQLLGINNINKL